MQYTISIEQSDMQPVYVHRWLNECSHWARGIPYDTVATMIEHSFCAGAFADGVQIGFARLITDYSIFAYLADVYVEEAHRGLGLSKQMMEALLGAPFVQNLRRLFLATKDAHSLYERYGFAPLRYPERMMEIFHEDLYSQQNRKPV